MLFLHQVQEGFLHQVQQGFCFISSPSFSVAGVGPCYIDLHFLWQVWHFCTSTVLLRGRRGTLWHGWNESNSHRRMFFVLVSLWNAFFFQSLAPVTKSDVCVYVGVSMSCVILCSEVIQNGCVLKWRLRVCSEVILLPKSPDGTFPPSSATEDVMLPIVGQIFIAVRCLFAEMSAWFFQKLKVHIKHSCIVIV